MIPTKVVKRLLKEIIDGDTTPQQALNVVNKLFGGL